MTATDVSHLVVGVVCDLNDPKKLGRVRVKFPHLGEKESQWARLVSVMAGPDRGFFFRPEKGDEVLVGFLQGKPEHPYILGAVWSQKQKPPADDGDAEKNNWRFLRSRSGHLVKLDDTDGKERIEIMGKGGGHKIVIDVSGKKVQVVCDSGDVEVTAKGGAVKVSAKTVEVDASGDMKLTAKGTLDLKGSKINLN